MPRRLAIPVLLLVAGAVVQTGVAWLVCWRSPDPSSPAVVQKMMEARTYVESGGSGGSHDQALVDASWPDRPPFRWETVRRLYIHEYHARGLQFQFALGFPEQPQPPADQMLHETAVVDMISARYGWPWPSLRVTEWSASEPAMSTLNTPGWRAGASIPRWLPQMNHWPHRLPIRPAWPAFALNTIVYAVALYSPWCLPIAIRRRRRRRTGRCLRCGYDLKGITAATQCPECGTVRVASQ